MKNMCFNYRGMNAQAILHTRCNLRCKFCFETKSGGIREDSQLSIPFIRRLPSEIKTTILPTMHKYDIRYFNMNIMGGELFSDDIPDEIFKEYETFCKELIRLFEVEDIQVKFTAVSNGIYENYNRITDLLQKFNMRIILSYDPVDRFSCDRQKEMWFNTYHTFRNCGIKTLVSTLLTKRIMHEYMYGAPFFEYIEKDVFIDTNIYVPRLDYQEYLPSDDDIYNFYKWCIDHGFFNLSDINNIMSRQPVCNQEWFFVFQENHRPMLSDCLEGGVIPKDQYYGSFWNKIKMDDSNCLKYKKPCGILKRGCFYCEYFDSCTEMCWTQILFQHYELNECPIKRIYQYMENNSQIVSMYDSWRSLYELSWKTNGI